MRDVRPATARARAVALALGGRAFPFVAGQAVELGTTDQPHRKPYSIACSPSASRRADALEFLIQFNHERGVEPHLLDLGPGRAVAVVGPSGTFTWPSPPRERQVLFIAGGTGIAPVRSMLWQAIDEGYRGRLTLVQSARTERDLAYADQFTFWAREGRLVYRALVTRGVAGPGHIWMGRLDRRRLASLVTDPETLCYVCGPASLLDEVPVMLRELGVVAGRIRAESWRERSRGASS